MVKFITSSFLAFSLTLILFTNASSVTAERLNFDPPQFKNYVMQKQIENLHAVLPADHLIVGLGSADISTMVDAFFF
jgi:hypothetical protein